MIRSALFVLLAGACCISAQVFKYPSGPNSCNYTSGYIDPAFCTIPNELPLGSFAPPQPGSSYVDYNFGGSVKLLTGPGYIHPYALPSPFSASNKYLVVREESSGNSHIINPVTGTVVYQNVPFSSAGRFWDPNDDESYYFLSGSKILKYTLNTRTTSTIVDYSTNGYNLTDIVTGGSSDTTKDNWLAFWAPNEKRICAVDLTSKRTYCAVYTASDPMSRVGWDFLDFVVMSKGVDSVSNKRYVLLMATPAMGAWSVNLQTGNLDFEFRGPENPDFPGNNDGVCDPNENCLSAPHADTMAGVDGRQYLVEAKGRNTPCELNVVALSLSAGINLWKPVSAGGGRNVVMKLANCGDVWPDHHIGCAKSAPYCVLSTMTGYYQNAWDTRTAIASVPHRDEIILMHGLGTEITRLAMSRSVQYTNDSYYTQVRAALSNDGSIIAFDSNFGNPSPGTVRVATVSTGVSASSTPTTPTTPVPVSVSVTPSSVTLAESKTQAFSAAVSGSSNTGVTWTYSPAVGTLTSTGVYTAPATITSSQAVTIKAVSLADATKSASATVNLTASAAPVGSTTGAIRVNAGGGSYTDPLGQVWSADYGFSGGAAYTASGTISGTNASTLYQSVRYGDTSYGFPVPNGSYTVKLKFAEVSGLNPGVRLFNVLLNGTTVLPNFDIAAAAGGQGIAVDKSFPVNVTSGKITIQTSEVKYGALISGIEIVPAVSAPLAASGFTPIRVNAGGSAYVDSLGQQWTSDKSYSGGGLLDSHAAITNTSNPALYAAVHWGDTLYRFQVPNGTYKVTLKFADPFLQNPGQRLFDVVINGATVLPRFDIIAAAGGPNRAVDRLIPVTVTGGQIAIQTSIVNYGAILSAIEIVQ